MLGKTMTGVLLEAFPTRRFVGPSPLELVADQGPWKTAPFFSFCLVEFLATAAKYLVPCNRLRFSPVAPLRRYIGEL